MAHIVLKQTGDHFRSALDNFVPGLSAIIKHSLQILHLDWDWIISRCAVLFALVAGIRPIFSQCKTYLEHFFTSSILIDSDDMLFHCILAFVTGHVTSGQIHFAKARTNDQALWSSESEISNISDTGFVNFSKRASRIPVIFEPYERRVAFRWRGWRFSFRREIQRSEVRFTPRESIILTVLGWSKEPIQRMILEARHEYYSLARCETSVLRPASTEERAQNGHLWTKIATRPSRQMDTVILPDSLKSNLLNALTLSGIPRAGHGKTSFAFALAGFFGVDTYVVSLNDPDMTEDLFFRLQSKLPRHSIFLLEDIEGVDLLKRGDQQSVRDSPASRRGVSLAGLLNAIDGVASQEGRVLIISTNYPDKLDGALTRPGRVDLTLNFGLATKEQMKKLFLRMYEDDKRKSERPVHNELTKDYALVELATKFSDELQDNTFSPAKVQGYLLVKKDPRDAVRDVGKWRDEQKTKVQSQERLAEKAQEARSILETTKPQEAI